MKELSIEQMELIKGGQMHAPDASCAIAYGLEAAAVAGIGGWVTGAFWPAAVLGGWVGGVVVGTVVCSFN